MAEEEKNMRETILENAKCLFIEHGYHGLSMREIAERAGVSKPALYYHFKDKEELFCAVLNDGLEEIGKAIDLINGNQISVQEKMCLFMEYVLTQPADQRSIIRLGTQEISQLSPSSRQIFAEAYHYQFIGKLKELIQRGIQNGEFRQMDADIATWALLGLMYPYLYPNQFSSSVLPLEKIQLIISIYMNGIRKEC